jgi:hypothetical protein
MAAVAPRCAQRASDIAGSDDRDLDVDVLSVPWATGLFCGTLLSADLSDDLGLHL